jgi:opacity protein-like surface antigen
MKRYLAVAVATTLIAAAAAATVAAQAPGWKQRIDASTSATDPDPAGQVKFMAMGGGFHTSNPQAATYWNPKNTAAGNYTLKATFAQNARSSHTNYLGLLFGGKDLEGANQTYTYFLVAPQNGTWLVKQRVGEQTKDISRGKHASIVQLDAGGKATNTLEVRVTADKVDYVVNGMVVGSSPKAAVTTDGIYGFRVNHALPDNMITDLSLSK